MGTEQKTVSIAELKARLSHYLRRVRRGETLVVTDRGRAVATLGPAQSVTLDERMQRLVDQGIARPPSGPPLPADFWTRPRPADPEGMALKWLLEEREHGR